MEENILSKLQTECPFPEVFQDMEPIERSIFEHPRRKIGHLRADYDGHRWWNTWWPSHSALITLEITAEIDRTFDALTAKDALTNLDTLRRFCYAHPETCGDKQFRDDYNFYLVGEHCDFWVRLITREKDYNMYLNAYVKDLDSQKEVSAE